MTENENNEITLGWYKSIKSKCFHAQGKQSKLLFPTCSGQMTTSKPWGLLVLQQKAGSCSISIWQSNIRVTKDDRMTYMDEGWTANVYKIACINAQIHKFVPIHPRCAGLFKDGDHIFLYRVTETSKYCVVHNHDRIGFDSGVFSKQKKNASLFFSECWGPVCLLTNSE